VNSADFQLNDHDNNVKAQSISRRVFSLCSGTIAVFSLIGRRRRLRISLIVLDRGVVCRTKIRLTDKGKHISFKIAKFCLFG
jgi:hypothetical protein